MPKKFRIEVRETLSRLVDVEAMSVTEAKQKVQDSYDSGEIVLDYKDYDGDTEFFDHTDYDNDFAV